MKQILSIGTSIACAVLIGFASSGCGSSGADEGPTRFDVSGTVTFNGAPVPAGTVLFQPDTSRGNDGPQGVATIFDGKFNTTEAGGRGTVGGPMVIQITGLSSNEPDPENPLKPIPQLFTDYEIRQELPKQETTLDFQVPKEAARTAQRGKPAVGAP